MRNMQKRIIFKDGLKKFCNDYLLENSGIIMSERETSQITDDLANRISINNNFGNVDLSAWLLSKLSLDDGETVFEMGCGTGKHIIEFAKAVKTPYACTGMDISKPSLDNAAAAAQSAGINIKWIHNSMDEFDDYSELYQTVIFIYSLYYSNNVNNVLSKACKLLKNNGRIVVIGPYSDNNKKWFDFIGQFMILPDNVKKSTTSFMYDDVLNYAVGHFGNIVCNRFVNTVHIPDIHEFKKYWKSNIYYKEEYDEAFEKYSKEYFIRHKSFTYDKVGLLVCMSDKLSCANDSTDYGCVS